ncbi:MAG: GIY-YIG nuclease family protein [Fluviicola sp.]|nr:GIY-YIG nuclease family protein [Fluviicola sp.]
MESYLEIKINWSEKFILDNIIDIENYQINSLNNVLYKIYGDSLLYGRDVLLYIGITVNVRNRFNAHLKSTFGPVNNLKVSIGEILNQPKEFNLEIPNRF